MTKQILILSLFFFLIVKNANANSAHFEGVTAKAVSHFMESVGTFNQFLSLLDAHLPSDEAAAIRVQFVKLGIDLNKKIPTMTTKTNSFEIAGTNAKIEILNDSEIRLKNKTYSVLNQDRPSIQIKKLIAHLQDKKFSYFSLLVPDAKAISEVLDSKPVAIGAMAVGYYATISALEWAGTKFALGVGFGMFGFPALAFGGLVWMGIEMYQTFRDGEVSCSGNHFVLRKKDRALGILPTSKVEVIELDKVKALLKKPNLKECNDKDADAFQEAVKKRIAKADEGQLDKEKKYEEARKRLFKEEGSQQPSNAIKESDHAR